MSYSTILVAELDAVLPKATPSRRTSMLHQLADLVVEQGEFWSQDQIDLIDAVMMPLVQVAERADLVELSRKLAPLDKAPVQTVARLCKDDDIAIAACPLEKCSVLQPDNIAEIALTKSADHLLSLAARAELAEPLTDILIDRKIPQVMHRLASNKGARISELGYVKLIAEAKHDRCLADLIAIRGGIPDELQPFLQLALR